MARKQVGVAQGAKAQGRPRGSRSRGGQARERLGGGGLSGEGPQKPLFARRGLSWGGASRVRWASRPWGRGELGSR